MVPVRALRPAPLLALALALAVAPACAARRGADAGAADDVEADVEDAPRRTTLRVDNLAFNDMTIYVIRSGSQRIRLGMAGGNRTTVIPIPNYLVAVPTPLQFLADPIGGRSAPVSSEITVNPGDEVVLQIPPA